MATYAKGKTTWVSKNFESTEFDCKCKKYCSTTEIDPQLVTYLQKIRDCFGKPVIINSAYRCKKHNKSVGGATYSKHLYGQAADIKVSGVSPLKVAQYAESIGIKGIGQYSNFVHIDTRSNKFFWYGNEQKAKATFGKYAENASSINEQPKQDNAPLGAGKVQITGGTVYIRKGPGVSYGLYNKLGREGNIFDAAQTEGWVPIQHDDEVLWISKKYIDSDGKCTGGSVNLRRGPGKTFDVVGLVYKGEYLSLLKTDLWVPIIIENSVYWVSKLYTKLN